MQTWVVVLAASLLLIAAPQQCRAADFSRAPIAALAPQSLFDDNRRVFAQMRTGAEIAGAASSSSSSYSSAASAVVAAATRKNAALKLRKHAAIAAATRVAAPPTPRRKRNKERVARSPARRALARTPARSGVFCDRSQVLNGAPEQSTLPANAEEWPVVQATSEAILAGPTASEDTVMADDYEARRPSAPGVRQMGSGNLQSIEADEEEKKKEEIEAASVAGSELEGLASPAAAALAAGSAGSAAAGSAGSAGSAAAAATSPLALQSAVAEAAAEAVRAALTARAAETHARMVRIRVSLHRVSLRMPVYFFLLPAEPLVNEPATSRRGVYAQLNRYYRWLRIFREAALRDFPALATVPSAFPAPQQAPPMVTGDAAEAETAARDAEFRIEDWLATDQFDSDDHREDAAATSGEDAAGASTALLERLRSAHQQRSRKLDDLFRREQAELELARSERDFIVGMYPFYKAGWAQKTMKRPEVMEREILKGWEKCHLWAKTGFRHSSANSLHSQLAGCVLQMQVLPAELRVWKKEVALETASRALAERVFETHGHVHVPLITLQQHKAHILAQLGSPFAAPVRVAREWRDRDAMLAPMRPLGKKEKAQAKETALGR